MGQFEHAVRSLLLDEQVCPKCVAANRPRMASPYIRLCEDGSYECTVCSHPYREALTVDRAAVP